MSSNAKNGPNSSPNYALIAGLGVVGAALGGGLAHSVLKLGPAESAGLAALGLLLAAGVGLIPSLGGDTKRLAAQVAVRKAIDSAYEQQSFGRLEQAGKLLQEALQRGQILPADDLTLLAANHSLGNLYRLQNQPDKAEAQYRQALKAYENLGKTTVEAYADCLRDCALVLEVKAQFQPSLDLAKKALAVYEFLNKEAEVASVLTLVARNTHALGLLEEAVATYRRVQALQLKLEGESSSAVVETLVTMGRCLQAQGKASEAIELYKDALTRSSKGERPLRLLEVEAMLDMAEASLADNNFKNVEVLCWNALKVMQTYLGPREKLLQRAAEATRAARQGLNLAVSDSEYLWLFTQNRDQVRDLFRERSDLVQQKDKNGWGPVQWTLFLGWEDLMRWLLRNGGPSDGFEESVMSPVHVAAAFSKGGTIGFLHEQGVNLASLGPQGWNAAHFAAYHGRQDCLEQLSARGCPVDLLDKQGRSPLHLAADQGHPEAVSFLLAKGVDKNLKDGRLGRSPLHYAARAGHGVVVRTLLMNGGDETLADKEGRTPMQLAEAAGHRGLMQAMKHFRQAMES